MVSAGKDRVNIIINWKKALKAAGYEVCLSERKNFSGSKKYKTKKKKYTIKNLKNKTYYIRVRAYRIVDGKKIYGKWSKRIKVARM